MELPIQTPLSWRPYILCSPRDRLLFDVEVDHNRWITASNRFHNLSDTLTFWAKQSAYGKATEDFVVALLRTKVSLNYTSHVGTPSYCVFTNT